MAMNASDERFPQAPQKQLLPRMGWLFFLGMSLALVGCTTTQRTARRSGPQVRSLPIKSPDPVVRMVNHRGRSIRYNVYNRSSKDFQGLVVIFEGVDCDGSRPRRLWKKSVSKQLLMGRMHAFRQTLPYYCHLVKVTAFGKRKFDRFKNNHKPFVRYRFIPDRRRVAYKIYNRSIIPFRGLTVLIFGKDCEGPRTNYLFVRSSRAWLRPGFLRSFARNMPYPCRIFRVKAYDRVLFHHRLRMIQRMRRRQQQMRRQRRRQPPISQEI